MRVRPLFWPIAALLVSVTLASRAYAGASLGLSSLGGGLGVSYGWVGGRDQTGLGVSVNWVGKYGVETEDRGLAAGNVMIQGVIEVWGLRPGTMYSGDISVVWVPHILPSRLRPYLGGGGGAANSYDDTPIGEIRTGPQPKVSAVAGLAYGAGWGESPERETMLSTWFLELRAGYYLGKIGMSEIVVRQGIAWLRF